MHKVATCLWFDTQAEEAAKFYTSVLEDSRITGVSYYGKGGHMPEGTVMMVTFDLAGTEYMALNGGPAFTHSEAVSIVVQCDSQGELDLVWERLLEGGGTEQQCGWLKDRYGLSWQVVPSHIRQLMTGPDEAAINRVMAAVMGMVRIDIAALERAHRG